MAVPERDHRRQSAWVSEALALAEERGMRRCDGNGLVIFGWMKRPVRTSELPLQLIRDLAQDKREREEPGKAKHRGGRRF